MQIFRRNRPVSALAGDCDVFITAREAAAAGHIPGNCARDLIRIDAAVGYGLREIPLLAVGARGIGAAFFAPRQALVDAIAISLVGDDEHTGVGKRRGGGKDECADKKRPGESHCSTDQNEESRALGNPQ